jgi:phosphoenolpyruvate carboxykinase (GTP)
MGMGLPQSGYNHSGNWQAGKRDSTGNDIPPAHKNARYTVRISELDNADPNLHNPHGVPVSAIIYGGRDSDTNVPVCQSLSWAHGVFLGATIESESTAATLGQTGVRKFSPMANFDFLVVPLGKYIANHLTFGHKLKKVPLVFKTNYFLKESNCYLNAKLDKEVWLMWMEGRVHGDFKAIATPIGYIPLYQDLKMIFADVFDRYYSIADYEKQFSVRLQKYLEQIARLKKIYAGEHDIPATFSEELIQQEKRLLALQDKFNKPVITPTELC